MVTSLFALRILKSIDIDSVPAKMHICTVQLLFVRLN